MSLLQNFVSPLSRTAHRGAARETRPSVKPLHEVKETAEAFGLVVYLPGVTREGLELAVGDGVIHLTGRRDWKAPAGWTTLYRETPGADFELELSHDNVIDVDRIHAELKDGVLRISLPKSEAIKSRKIAVN
jgi:HSP20 family molecular chaperone IbpA